MQLSPQQDPTASSTEEPRCLITPESRWYRPGLGFTCRQIMLPLMVIGLLTIVLIVGQGVALFRSAGGDIGSWVTMMALLVILGLTVRALFFVRWSLVDPLTQVRYWVSRVRGGDLAARMPALSRGEFNELATDINGLAKDLETLHGNLEAEVASKTEILARKSRALELLYEVVTLVNESHEANDVLRHFLHRLGDVFSADAGVLRVFDERGLRVECSFGLDPESVYLKDTVPTRSVVQTNRSGDNIVSVQTESSRDFRTVSAIDTAEVRQKRKIVSVPLQHRDSILGSYQLLVAAEIELDVESLDALTSVGQHLGVMMEQSRLDTETTRLLMVEERARLANELHDSLAQTLASLRFQVRVLDETVQQGDEKVTWQELEKLEEQVEIANAELRALVGQFRAPLHSREIVFSIEKLVQRFRRDSGISVFFQNEWSDDSLSIEQRTHIIRIVQEALANIRKHARANSVRVLIRNNARGYRLVVEDDGEGYEKQTMTNAGPGEHIGRQIMRERAESLNAELKLESECGEGSLVSLEYRYPEPIAQPALATA